MADNLLTSAALASPAPLLVAPAMNNQMWDHPATQANLELLRDRGVAVVPPGGRVARLEGRVGLRAGWPTRPRSSPRSSSSWATTLRARTRSTG